MSDEPDHIYLDLSICNNDKEGSQNKTFLSFSENRTNAVLNNPSNYEMSIARFEVDTPAATLPIFIPLLNIDGVNTDLNQTSYTITMAQINGNGNALTNLQTTNVEWSPEDVSSLLPVNASIPVEPVTNTINALYNTPQALSTITADSAIFSAKDIGAIVSPTIRGQTTLTNYNYTIVLDPTDGYSLSIPSLALPAFLRYPIVPGSSVLILSGGSSDYYTVSSSQRIFDLFNGFTLVIGLGFATGLIEGSYTDSLNFFSSFDLYQQGTVITGLVGVGLTTTTVTVSPSYTVNPYPAQVQYSGATAYYLPPANITTNLPIPNSVPLVGYNFSGTFLGKTIQPLMNYYITGVGLNYSIFYSTPLNQYVVMLSGLSGDMRNLSVLGGYGVGASGFPTSFTGLDSYDITYNSTANVSQIILYFPFVPGSFTPGIKIGQSISLSVAAPVFLPYTTITAITPIGGGFSNIYVSLQYTYLYPSGQSDNPAAGFDGYIDGTDKTGYILTASEATSQLTILTNVITPKPTLISQDITSGYYNCYSVKWWVSCVNSALNKLWVSFEGNTSDRSPYIVADKQTNLMTLITPLQNLGPDIIDNFAVSSGFQLGTGFDPIYLSVGSPLPVQYVLFFNEPLFNLFSGFPSVYYGDTLVNASVFDNAPDNAIIQARPYLLEYFIQPVAYQYANIITLTNLYGGNYKWVTTASEYSPVPMWNPIMSLQFTSNLLPNLLSYTTAAIPYNALNGSGYTSSGNNSQITNMITDIQVGLVSGSEYKPSVLYVPKGQYRLIDLQGNQPIHNVDFQVSWKTKYGQVIAFRLGAQCGANLKILFRRKRFNLLNLPPYDTN